MFAVKYATLLLVASAKPLEKSKNVAEDYDIGKAEMQLKSMLADEAQRQFRCRMDFQGRVFHAVELEIMKHSPTPYDETTWYENNEDRLMCDVLDGYNDKLWAMKQAHVAKHQAALSEMIKQSEAAHWDNETLEEHYHVSSWWWEDTFMGNFLAEYHEKRNALEAEIMGPLVQEIHDAFESNTKFSQ